MIINRSVVNPWEEISMSRYKLLRQQKIGLLVSFALLAAGFTGWLMPNTFLPDKVDVYILTEPELSLKDHYGNIVYTHIVWDYAPSKAYALIEGSDGKGEFWIRDTPFVTASLSYDNRNVNLEASTPIGYVSDPESRTNEITISHEYLDYKINLSKNGMTREIFRDAGDPPEDFTVNLRDLEAEKDLTPPYTLTCTGEVGYVLNTNIDKVQGKKNIVFWSLSVMENSTLAITRYADMPVESIHVTALWLKILQDIRLPTTLIGLISLAIIQVSKRHGKEQSLRPN